MADKAISELIAANQVTPTDLFVLEQNGTAKKLTGQALEGWLVSFADGHGGIQSIEKISTSGLADTYRITLADTTHFDFVVTNGRGISGIEKTSTSGLVDIYTITMNDGTTSELTVTNGEKGDKGDNTYVWIKYASQEPTESSNSMGDVPDAWIGIYYGNASSPPSDWKQYKWYEIKGDKGDKGDAATLVSKSVTYQVGDSGSIVPSGSWSNSVPIVPQSKYLWTKTEIQFNSGDPIVSYSVARMGIDGSGSVSYVNNVSPNENGNVMLTASNVGALPSSGGTMTGAINMNGHPISGLNQPTQDTQAANKGYVDAAETAAISHANAVVRAAAPRNLLDNSYLRNPVNQRGQSSYTGTYGIDRWRVWEEDVLINWNINNGIGVETTGKMFQYLELNNIDVTKTYTLAASRLVEGDKKIIILSKTVEGYEYNSDLGLGLGVENDKLVVVLGTGTYEWAALYEGEYTAETLPKYHPKGYGAELAECQRYFIRIGTSDYTPLGMGQGRSNNTVMFMINLPVTMRRVQPIVSLTGSTYSRTGDTYRESTDIRVDNSSFSSLLMSAVTTGVSIGAAYEMFLNRDLNSYLDIIADL